MSDTQVFIVVGATFFALTIVGLALWVANGEALLRAGYTLLCL